RESISPRSTRATSRRTLVFARLSAGGRSGIGLTLPRVAGADLRRTATGFDRPRFFGNLFTPAPFSDPRDDRAIQRPARGPVRRTSGPIRRGCALRRCRWARLGAGDATRTPTPRSRLSCGLIGPWGLRRKFQRSQLYSRTPLPDEFRVRGPRPGA